MKRVGKSFVILFLILFLIPVFVLHRGFASLVGDTAYIPFIERSVDERRSEPFTFISWSDTQNGTASLFTLSDQAMKLKPDFTIFPGDLEPSGFTLAEITSWKTALNGSANNGMFDLTLPIRGNHDGENAAGWQAYFDTRNSAINLGAVNFSAFDEDLTYSFDYRNSFFVGIDVLGPITQIQPESVAYLDQALTAAEQRGLTHAFLYFHGPLYMVSDYGAAICTTRTCPAPATITGLIDVLNKHPIVSAVFSGHEHVHAYVHIDGTRMPEITHPFEEFITASTGAGYDSCDYTYRHDFCGSYHGFWTISVNGKAFTARVYKVGNPVPMQTFSFHKP